MIYNQKQANDESFPVMVNGKALKLNQEQIDKLIRRKLLSDPTVHKLFEKFEMDPSRLENLRFEIVDLDGRYAETDEQVMKLDRNLFKGDFFNEEFFIVLHELVHWLSRVKESDAYFNDPEEVLGFIASIAYELNQGKELDVVWNKIYPKIEFHFNDERDSRDFFQKSIEKAHGFLL